MFFVKTTTKRVQPILTFFKDKITMKSPSVQEGTKLFATFADTYERKIRQSEIKRTLDSHRLCNRSKHPSYIGRQRSLFIQCRLTACPRCNLLLGIEAHGLPTTSPL